jgi:hypothetical protein
MSASNDQETVFPHTEASPTSSEETISLSVQGNLFVLKRQAILSFDWMIARMLTTSVPLAKHKGMIYIDVDSTSFRIILAILQGNCLNPGSFKNFYRRTHPTVCPKKI